MLRVLFLNRDLEFSGGVPNVLLTLARANDPARADYRFASLQTPSEAMVDALRELNIEPFCIGDRGYFGPAKLLRKFIRENAIDLVVANSFKSSLVAKIATFGSPCRVVHYIHAIDLVMEGRIKPRGFAAIARRDPMLFVSRAVELAHRPKNHQGPAAVVYNGVRDPFEKPETEPYPRNFRAQLNIPEDALLLCYIGAFIGWKDHTTILHAFQKLDPALNAHLMLIGKREIGSNVEEQVEAMNNPRVRIIKPRPDARRILGAVDIYVHSSRREGFGLAVVEAMLAGRPVVVTREGAFPEYVEDGKTGLLAEPGDPSSFAAKIEQLARDPESARRIGAAGRQACLERFSPAAAAAAVRNFLIAVAPGGSENLNPSVESVNRGRTS
jgi:glycosyltransferase involved in cell wall biosynthesis